jgi:hypothetical protein
LGRRPKHLRLVGNLHSEREKNFSFGIEATGSSGLDTIDRQGRKARFARQFSLAHHERFSISLNVVARHRPPLQSNVSG